MESRAAPTLRFADGGALEMGARTLVMGVINVTPDSFSDGARFANPRSAVRHALEMARGGADLLDVGGESTRPGAIPVSATEEADRILPVIEGIKRKGNLRVSVDTMKPDVARQAIDAGADLVNDVGALGDEKMLRLVSELGVPVVLMHMRGTPRTMQRNTDYDDLVDEVIAFLRHRMETTVAAGLSNDKIMVDPGIGFGKSVRGNLTILKRLSEFTALGRPILVGASRKSFIGAVLDLPVQDRLEGSLAVAAFASAQGAHVVRTHDVVATVRAVRMIDAVREVERAPRPGSRPRREAARLASNDSPRPETDPSADTK